MNLKAKLSTFFRPYRNRRRQQYFLKKYGVIEGNFIILSNNCIGGMCYHDANKAFLSPTINLIVDDFLTFVTYANDYVSCEIEMIENSGHEYPFGILKPNNDLPPINIHFIHYHSSLEAKTKWIERSKRMLSDNGKLCVLYSVPKNKPFGKKEIEIFSGINAYRKVCFYRTFDENIPNNTESTRFIHIPQRYQSMDFSKYTGLFSRKRYFDLFFNLFEFLFT